MEDYKYDIGELVYAAEDILNDGGMPGIADEEGLIAPAGMPAWSSSSRAEADETSTSIWSVSKTPGWRARDRSLPARRADPGTRLFRLTRYGPGSAFSSGPIPTHPAARQADCKKLGERPMRRSISAARRWRNSSPMTR